MVAELTPKHTLTHTYKHTYTRNVSHSLTLSLARTATQQRHGVSRRWCCLRERALSLSPSLSLSPPPAPPIHPPSISGKSMESIEAMVVELDPTFQVDEMLLNPHPFNLSITEGGGDEVSLFLLVCAFSVWIHSCLHVCVCVCVCL
jgi:hypothetical protein